MERNVGRANDVESRVEVNAYTMLLANHINGRAIYNETNHFTLDREYINPEIKLHNIRAFIKDAQ